MTTPAALSMGHETLSRRLVLLLAIGTGIGVANVYYIQPILSLVQRDFDVPPQLIGWAPTLTQIGYALGILLLAPLGDMLSRRSLIVCKGLLLVLALVAAALSPNYAALILTSAAIGLFSSVGQDFIPVAAQLAPDAHRGRIVGTVTTGLLTGVLLSRTLGGLVAQQFGWRAIYAVAAALEGLVVLAVWRLLPALPVSAGGRYSQLMASLVKLWRQHAALRRAVYTQGLLAMSLGAFWSTLALVLAAPPYHQGSGVAGAYGVAGAAGALAAPLFGRFADRAGPLPAIRVGCLLVIGSFVGMWIFSGSLIALAIGAVLFDLGVMAALVSHQTIVNTIDPIARSRLNGILITGAMFGVAVGAEAGNLALIYAGWPGICAVGVIVGGLALLLRLGNR
ncbi:MFS transporter [Burkholderia oklahomensis]|uniref:Major Facilitator Superfamily protein n=1 Tax=Burkholderia oklahomensis TaxID=342113 RepID=A0AAI8FMB0_9BURK|nr:MFS transporter [Burkholderia oklahomensis]AIO65625.1 major Facilitator Superfamily protein [Burkholderia oklahomensis]SUW55538.1 Inner membrane transport protein ynfM [Burkholderia oklahomensis]